MQKYETEQIYNINIDSLFSIIIEVEKYPEFLPWCINSKIISKTENTIYADVMVDFKGLTEKYTSKIQFSKPNLVNVESIKGPFKSLRNQWELEYIDQNHTKLRFTIDFEFKSKILNQLIKFIYKSAISKITNAFIQRAEFIKSHID